MYGFMCVSIDKAMEQILHHINIGVRCNKELASLKYLIMSTEPIIKQIRQHRLVMNWKKSKDSAVNEWLNDLSGWLSELDALLQQTSEMVQQCTVPVYGVFLTSHMSKRITSLTSSITENIKLMSPLVDIARTDRVFADASHITRGSDVVTATFAPSNSGWQSVSDVLAPSTSSATSSQAASIDPLPTARMKLMDETLIVGQHRALENLEKLVKADADASKFIGVLGKGGSGKTLLLKTLFNDKKVRNHFSDALLLWLTVSQCPSFTSLMNQLWTQIAIQSNVDVVKNINEEHTEKWIILQNSLDAEEEQVKKWLIERLQQSSKFVLFLDDVWKQDAGKLLQRLGILHVVSDHSNSKVIVSSRDQAALLKMRITDEYTIKIRDLNEHASWKLFAHHAFPNNRNPPSNEKAKLLCHMCERIPLAIKVVGSAMAGGTHPKQWIWALQRLSNAESIDDCLRFSFDSLGKEDVNIESCLLLVAAASLEDEILFARHVIMLWAGEGLLSAKTLQDGYDPFKIGWIYLNILADRCLIEPMMRDYDGHVVCFKMHDALRDLAIRIAVEEEKFYCSVGRGLTGLNVNECSGSTRILLSRNKLSSFDQSLSLPHICSFLISENRDLTEIPESLIGSMISLKVLDLSGTAVQSLPESLGRLKHLVSLRLLATPIKRLPASFTNLVNVEILDLSFSSITKLPSRLHMLKSLRYLGLHQCKDLQSLPYSISRLSSLQCLHMAECSTLWKKPVSHRCKKVASIHNLGGLKQLKRLELQNNGETMSAGTLGSMAQIHTLRLILTGMKSLPSDMSNMSNLERLSLKCSHLVKMDSNFHQFKKLSSLILFQCGTLTELPNLHKLESLRRLEIIACSKLRKFPEEFGDKGAFPLLEIFSLVRLEKLKELPQVREGAMALLRIFTIMECPTLKILPKTYLNLKTLKKIRIYGCSDILKKDCEDILKKDCEEVQKINIEVITMSDIQKLKTLYFQFYRKHGSWYCDEFWCNGFGFLLGSLDIII